MAGKVCRAGIGTAGSCRVSQLTVLEALEVILGNGGTCELCPDRKVVVQSSTIEALCYTGAALREGGSSVQDPATAIWWFGRDSTLMGLLTMVVVVVELPVPYKRRGGLPT